MEFDDATKSQIRAVQLWTALNWIIKKAEIMNEAIDGPKIQKIFNIINDKDINYGIKEDNTDGRED